MNPAREPVHVLLVEDNPPDVRLTVEAFAEGNVRCALHVVNDGEQAMAFLRGLGPYHDAPRPDLVLLDLNLPRKDGREVLREIDGDEGLRHIPIVVLSTSQADQDIVQSYRLGANAFVTKPVDLDGFLDAVHSIERFWLETAQLTPP